MTSDLGVAADDSKAIQDFQYAIYLMLWDAVKQIRLKAVLDSAALGFDLPDQARRSLRHLLTDTLKQIALESYKEIMAHLERTDFVDATARAEAFLTFGAPLYDVWKARNPLEGDLGGEDLRGAEAGLPGRIKAVEDNRLAVLGQIAPQTEELRKELDAVRAEIAALRSDTA